MDNRMDVLSSIENKAIDWIIENIDNFNPLVINSERNFRAKAFLELALLISYKNEITKGNINSEYTRIMDFIFRIGTDPAYYYMLARDHRSLLLYAFTFVALEKCKLNVESFRWVIQRTLESDYVINSERIPYRQLDLQHFLYLFRKRKQIKIFKSIAKHTLLFSNFNVLELNESDVYAITHSIFYLTNFGFDGNTLIKNKATIFYKLQILLDYYRLSDNADIVSELLICCTCIRGRSTKEVDAAWHYLSKKQVTDGSYVGPDNIVNNKAEDSSYNYWKKSYHTTLVAVLAAFLERNNLKKKKKYKLPKYIYLPIDSLQIKIYNYFLKLSNTGDDVTLVHSVIGIYLNLRIAPKEKKQIIEDICSRINTSTKIMDLLFSLGIEESIFALMVFDSLSIKWSYVDTWRSDLLSILSKHHGVTSELYKYVIAEVKTNLKTAKLLPFKKKKNENYIEYASRVLFESMAIESVIDSRSETIDLCVLRKELIDASKSYDLNAMINLLRYSILYHYIFDRIIYDSLIYLETQITPLGTLGYYILNSMKNDQAETKLTINYALLLSEYNRLTTAST